MDGPFGWAIGARNIVTVVFRDVAAFAQRGGLPGDPVPTRDEIQQ